MYSDDEGNDASGQVLSDDENDDSDDQGLSDESEIEDDDSGLDNDDKEFVIRSRYEYNMLLKEQ